MKKRKWNGLFKVFLIGLALFMLLFSLSADVQAKVMRIGVMGPMNFKYGDHAWKAAVLAAEEINAAGGVNINGVKHEIEIVKADSNCFVNVTDAINAMERLVTRRNVHFVSGGYRTETTLAQQEIMADNKVILISGGAAHPELTERVAKDYDRYKYYFRNWTRSSEMSLQYVAELEPIIKAFREQLGIEKPRVAILMDRAQWTEPQAEMAKKLLPLMGAEISGDWRHAFTATDLSAELSAIQSTGTHIIYQMNAGPAGAVLGRQWGEMKIPAALAGGSVEGGDAAFWETTGGACNYAASTAYMRIAVTEKAIPFWDSFVEKYKETPIYQAPLAYDHIYILKEAVEKAGSLDSDTVIPVLEKIRYEGAYGLVEFNPPGHPNPHDQDWGPTFTSLGGQWRDGKQYAYWPDGDELHPAILEYGASPGWEGVRFEGTVDYQIPPWVMEYWKNKKD